MLDVCHHVPSLTSEHRYAASARAMVEEQLRDRGIHDVRILDAMQKLPRHRFVPSVDPEQAYEDCALPTEEGQTISQPYITAWMTQWLAIGDAPRVLEIGTGSGYQTALLSMLGAEVITVERHAGLSATAKGLLTELGLVDRVRFVVADGSLGYAAGAPYGRILVSASAPRLPHSLRCQLGVTGMAVIPLGDRVEQTLTRIIHDRDGWRHQAGLGCRFVPLVGEDAWPQV